MDGMALYSGTGCATAAFRGIERCTLSGIMESKQASKLLSRAILRIKLQESMGASISRSVA